MGQASTQRAHLIQGYTSSETFSTDCSLNTNNPETGLVMGTSSDATVEPIIGPPRIK